MTTSTNSTPESSTDAELARKQIRLTLDSMRTNAEVAKDFVEHEVAIVAAVDDILAWRDRCVAEARRDELERSFSAYVSMDDEKLGKYWPRRRTLLLSPTTGEEEK